MLTENDVIEAVMKRLVRNGYKITARCTTAQRGIDIVAAHPRRGTLLVEAKGETSSRATTRRYGKPFSQKQVTHHVARAFYTAVCMAEKNVGARCAIALPDTPLHRDRVGRVEATIAKLGITVYFVSAAKRVRILAR